MAEPESAASTRIRKEARPWSGFFLGLLLGLAVAVVLQQAGIWPLDRLLLFGSAGLFALIGILLGTAGRIKVSAFNTILPIILAVALLGFGATGLASINENGVLNGGCTVEAASEMDSTVVTDTSRQDPFEVDPEGGLSWVARSPAVITNHFWEIYVDIGGFPVTVAGNEQAETNADGAAENTGEVDNVSAYVREVSNLVGFELAGVFEVGGEIEGDGGACDGFGFVTLTAAPLTTLVSWIAAAIGLLSLIGLLVLAFNRTEVVEVIDEREGPVDNAAPTAGPAGEEGETVGTEAVDHSEDTDQTGRGAHVRRDQPDGGEGTEGGDTQ